MSDPTPGVPSTPLLVWLTSTADRRDHAVTDTEMESGVTAGQGEYHTVCGHLVHVGSLHDAPGPRCIRCRAATEPPKRRRKRRRFGWLAR